MNSYSLRKVLYLAFIFMSLLGFSENHSSDEKLLFVISEIMFVKYETGFNLYP
jgi:hypothetical protein